MLIDSELDVCLPLVCQTGLGFQDLAGPRWWKGNVHKPLPSADKGYARKHQYRTQDKFWLHGLTQQHHPENDAENRRKERKNTQLGSRVDRQQPEPEQHADHADHQNLENQTGPDNVRYRKTESAGERCSGQQNAETGKKLHECCLGRWSLR